MSRSRALILGTVYLMACGTDPEEFGRCTGPLAITVSSSVQPEVAWTPTNCPVNEVAVDDASGPLWSLYNPEPVNEIESPVRYGQPASAGESQSPGPDAGGPALTRGSRYMVSLRRIDPNGLVVVAGEQPFIYQPQP